MKYEFDRNEIWFACVCDVQTSQFHFKLSESLTKHFRVDIWNLNNALAYTNIRKFETISVNVLSINSHKVMQLNVI